MKSFVSPEWLSFLQSNGLAKYETLWNLDVGWVEPPNYRRGGWSGVCRMELSAADGDQRGVYIKRQENHQCLTLRHPLKGEATFAREFRMIRYLREHDVPTLNPLYFGEQSDRGAHQAILMTEALENYQSMEALLYGGQLVGMPITQQRRLLSAIADTVRRLHQAKVQHRSLHPKHLMVREGPTYDVALIDLEKARRCVLPLIFVLRDLATLNRHSNGLSRSNRLFFLVQYLGGAPLGRWGRWMARTIERMSQRRQVPPKRVHGGKLRG